MRDINIKFIPHNKQHYPTVGDYWETKNTVEFRISKMSDWRYMMLVTIHELIEYSLITYLKIPIKVIDEWDIKFEEDRAKGKHKPTQEPGDHPRCPYKIPHRFATKCEKALCFLLGCSWSRYSKEVESL